MRRVIDDSMYPELSEKIMDIVKHIPGNRVSEYEYGMHRANRCLIKNYILERIENVKYGKDMNTTGIGNNACYELIYTGNCSEEQVFGIIHLTDDMFGSQIVWVSDIDNVRKTISKTISGC